MLMVLEAKWAKRQQRPEPGGYRTSWRASGKPLLCPKEWLLPLLDFRIAEGGEAWEAILLMVVNHVLRDLVNGREGSWPTVVKQKRKQIWYPGMLPETRCPATPMPSPCAHQSTHHRSTPTTQA